MLKEKVFSYICKQRTPGSYQQAIGHIKVFYINSNIVEHSVASYLGQHCLQ